MTQDTQPLVVPYHQDARDSLTKYDLGVLAIRLTGLYFLIQAVTYASYIPVMLQYGRSGTGQDWSLLAMNCIPSAMFAAAGIILWRWTNWIARRAFPEFASGASLTMTGHDLQAVAFSVVGVGLVAWAVPDAARQVMQYWWSGRTATPRYEMIPDAVRLLVQVAAGTYLFARAKGLSAAWHRLRYAGGPQVPRDDAGSTP